MGTTESLSNAVSRRASSRGTKHLAKKMVLDSQSMSDTVANQAQNLVRKSGVYRIKQAKPVARKSHLGIPNQKRKLSKIRINAKSAALSKAWMAKYIKRADTDETIQFVVETNKIELIFQ